jgi:hypothetical protein
MTEVGGQLCYNVSKVSRNPMRCCQGIVFILCTRSQHGGLADEINMQRAGENAILSFHSNTGELFGTQKN